MSDEYLDAIEIDNLKEELNALRPDAERYRWLRSRAKEYPEGWYFEEHIAGTPSIEDLDAAIDAAREKP